MRGSLRLHSLAVAESRHQAPSDQTRRAPGSELAKSTRVGKDLNRRESARNRGTLDPVPEAFKTAVLKVEVAEKESQHHAVQGPR